MRREPLPFSQTSRFIGSKAGSSGGYVVKLAKAGHLPHVVASDGTFLFQVTAVTTVKRLKVEGLARRGGAHGRAAATAAAV